MKSFSYQLIFYILIFIKSAHPLPNGAPASACATMTPQHSGVSSQTCSNKYVIQADKTAYFPNDTVRITVSGSTSTDMFRGVLIEARTQTDGQIIGTWTVVNSTTQTLACGGVANSAITHTSRDDKLSVQAIWTPPPGTSTENTLIRATIVQQFDTIFVNCFSLMLMNRLNNQVSNGTTVAQSSTAATSANSVTTSTAGSASVATSTVGADISWTYANGVTSVRMRITNLRASQWFAIGLSLDDRMRGQDHVFACKRLANDLIMAERLYNPGGYVTPDSVATGAAQGATFSPTSQRLDNGMVYCEFTLSAFTSTRTRRQANILSSSTSYTPLIVFGNLNPSGGLIMHTSRTALSQKYQLNQQANILFNDDGSGSRIPKLIKAHGIFMLITWIYFASIGILCARFYKPSWPQKTIWQGDLFREEEDGFRKMTKRVYAHSIVGILVICFALVQPIIAFFRCTPDAPNRFIFNYVHRSVGSIAFVLSVVAIFLALFFRQFDFEMNKIWGLMVAWTCWVFVVYITLWALEVYFYEHRPRQEEADGYDLGDPMFKDNSAMLRHQAKQDRIQLVILILHTLVALGIAIALASIVGTA